MSIDAGCTIVMSSLEEEEEDRECLNIEQENEKESMEGTSTNWEIDLNNEMETADSNIESRPTKRNREEEGEEEQEDGEELKWTTVEKKGKKIKTVQTEILISSKQKLPKQFAIAKLFTSLDLIDITKIKYINPYKIRIDVPNENCAKKIMECQEFKNREWRVQKAHEVNISYGIIRNVDLEVSEEEAWKSIKCPNEMTLVSFKRLNRRDEEGKWIPSEAARVGFGSHFLPANIFIGNLCTKVEPYVFPTTQCSRCWKFGHIKTRCTSSKIICPKCGGFHENCETNSYRCVNCYGEHISLNRACPVYVREKRLRELMSEFNCTYRTACNMYIPQQIKSKDSIYEEEHPHINLHNRFSNLSSEARGNYTYTPAFPIYTTPKSNRKLPPERSKSPPLQKITDKREDYASRVGISEQKTSDRQPSRRSDRIPVYDVSPPPEHNETERDVNNRREVHFSELLTRLKEIVFIQNLSTQVKIKNVIKSCIEWLVLIVVDNISEWPILNSLLSLINGL